MSFRRTLLVVLGVSLLVFWYHKKNTRESSPIVEPVSKESAGHSESPSPNIKPSSPAPKPLIPSQTSVTNEKERVIRELNGLSACVGFTNVQFDSNDMQSSQFLNKLQDSFGPIQNTSEDWSRRGIKTPQGEERSLKIEVTSDENDVVHRHLTYYGSFDETEESIIHVSEELRQNPSETLIASLTSDGEIIKHERFLTLYFATGEQATLLERNGQVADFQYELNGKSFQCRNMDQPQGGCSCQP